MESVVILDVEPLDLVACFHRIFFSREVIDEGDQIVQYTFHVLFGRGVVHDLSVCVQIVVSVLIDSGNTVFQALQIGEQTHIQKYLTPLIKIHHSLPSDVFKKIIRLRADNHICPRSFSLQSVALCGVSRIGSFESEHSQHTKSHCDKQQNGHGYGYPYLILHWYRPPWYRIRSYCPRPRR